jgi:hypothetical protein
VSKVPPGVKQDELYIAARRILLDAAGALAEQHEALILVGAQAVYLRAGTADIPVAVYTADADIGIDRTMLSADPRLQDAMRAAGFELRITDRIQPGTWVRAVRVGERELEIPVDLLIPSKFSDRTSPRRRSASIPPHDKMAVRRVEGIELALVDNDQMLIESLEPGDRRSVVMKVAGAAALLTAKAYKIRDRVAEMKPGREADKDAGDVIRLMRTSEIRAVRASFTALIHHEDERVATTAEQGLHLLIEQFGRPRAVGVEMAQRALAGALPQQTIEALATAFTRNLPNLAPAPEA